VNVNPSLQTPLLLLRPRLLNILNPNHSTLLLLSLHALSIHLRLTLPPDLIIHLSIHRWSRQLRRQLIPADYERWVCFEESVDVFEAAVGGFRVEEVGYWDEGEADYGLEDALVGVSWRVG
jgi:hypothetical protein